MQNIQQDVQGYGHGDSELLRTGRFSDCIIKCGNKEWKVHRSILCTRSRWFSAAFDGPFREAQTGILTINESTNPDNFEVILKWIYNPDTFDIYNPDNAMDNTNFLLHVRDLYQEADFYLLPTLCDEIKARTHHILNTADTRMTHGTIHQNAWQDVIAGALAAFEETDDNCNEIRQLFVRYVTVNYHYLMSIPEFPDMLKGSPLFAVAILQQLHKVMRHTVEEQDADFFLPDDGMVYNCCICNGIIFGAAVIMIPEYGDSKYYCTRLACRSRIRTSDLLN